MCHVAAEEGGALDCSSAAVGGRSWEFMGSSEISLVGACDSLQNNIQLIPVLIFIRIPNKINSH